MLRLTSLQGLRLAAQLYILRNVCVTVQQETETGVVFITETATNRKLASIAGNGILATWYNERR